MRHPQRQGLTLGMVAAEEHLPLLERAEQLVALVVQVFRVEEAGQAF